MPNVWHMCPAGEVMRVWLEFEQRFKKKQGHVFNNLHLHYFSETIEREHHRVESVSSRLYLTLMNSVRWDWDHGECNNNYYQCQKAVTTAAGSCSFSTSSRVYFDTNWEINHLIQASDRSHRSDAFNTAMQLRNLSAATLYIKEMNEEMLSLYRFKCP